MTTTAATGATGAAGLAGLNGLLGQVQNIAAANGLNVAGSGATPAANAPAPVTGAAAGGDAAKAKAHIPATGKVEMRVVNGETKYFDSGVDPATGAMRANGLADEITAFQFTESHKFKVTLDYREGIATGLSNLAKIFGARQERVRLLSNALANDANTTGSFNPVDLQQMSLETTTTQQLSEMQKKIFDSMRDAIQPWLR